MLLHIYTSKGDVEVDLDFDGDVAQKSQHSKSTTIKLSLSREQQEALRAVYVLMGHQSGPVFWAIQTIAKEAFKAGQKMPQKSKE